jgi:Domain of unknown function (DUF6532)
VPSRQLVANDNVDNDIDNNDGDIDDYNDDDIDNDDIDNNSDEDNGNNTNNVDNLNDFGEEPEDPNDEDDSASPSCGDKRRHSHTGLTSQWRNPVKVNITGTTGVRPKARDYEAAVQQVLAEAIPLFRGYLCSVTPYPGPMDETRWAKKSWKDACEKCGTLMAPNDEIIKLVSASCCSLSAALLLTNMLCSRSLKITIRSSHFRGRVKTKVEPLVKTMYAFIPNSKQRNGNANYNIELARELKDKFGFVYAVCLSFIIHIYLLIS